jgi:hypothetical protein
MIPDAQIQVRFLTTSEGGRKSDLFCSRYGCPLFIEGYEENGFDCRFLLEANTHFELGALYEIKIKFLNPELALAHLHIGAAISLWEGRTIAKGRVVSIKPENV